MLNAVFLLFCLVFGNLLPAAHAAEAFAPDYDVVFPEYRISDFKIVIQPADWVAMRENMRKIYGEPGRSTAPPGAPGKPGEGGPGFPEEKPMWVNARIIYLGKTWENVAVRYKGNSSLLYPWLNGSKKLPFKIDFQKFVGSGKRTFHGFEELSLANNFADQTYLREPFAYRLLAEMGFPASRTALYNVILDYGQGEQRYGLYTAIEVTNDTVIKGFFGEDRGNIYEAEGMGASLAQSVTRERVEKAFQKENNKRQADWSDMHALHQLLHDPERLRDPSRWRAGLERTFGVGDFLRWLGVSAVIEHWDTYGGISHNFYLYNQNGKLHWISWDHNLILGAKIGKGPPKEGGQLEAAAGMPGFPRVSLDRAEVTDEWPLIRFLLDDPVYARQYRDGLRLVRDRHFDAAKVEADLRRRAVLVRPFLSVEECVALDEGLEQLINHVRERARKLAEFLGAEKVATN